MSTTKVFAESQQLDRAVAAFLGAAVGDALGWPNEARARSSSRESQRKREFVAWTKRSGGRFAPHEERISAGEYSDDTQLILAVSRARIYSSEWWKHLAHVELPFWTVYERGGGGATRRSAGSWLSGAAPWEKGTLAGKYFDAGGNGVAMRILPHCLAHRSDETFSELAVDILSDGVTTHGHPRAHVGALAYGFALWSAFRLDSTLRYGQLLEEALEHKDIWGRLPSLKGRWASWSAALPGGEEEYERRWNSTVHEMSDLLECAHRGLRGGAIAGDFDVLTELGSFNPKVNGAGTVTAAAALYLVSRYAASSLEGVLQAAFAVGSDTDTTASMVGGMLGAINGISWVEPYVGQLQDAAYMRDIATALQEGATAKVDGRIFSRITREGVSALTDVLRSASDGDAVALPNGSEGRIEGRDVQREGKVAIWKVAVSDGYTLYLKHISQKATDSRPSNSPTISHRGFEAARIGISIGVRDLRRSRRFYEEVLGLSVVPRSETSLIVQGSLALKECVPSLFSSEGLTIFLEVSNIDACFEAVARQGIALDSPLTSRGRSRSFICRDPDGYLVEVYQRAGSSPTR